jgi:hypothetical protein
MIKSKFMHSYELIFTVVNKNDDNQGGTVGLPLQ